MFKLQRFNYLRTLFAVNQESKKVCLLQSRKLTNILQTIMRTVYTYEEKIAIKQKSCKLLISFTLFISTVRESKILSFIISLKAHKHIKAPVSLNHFSFESAEINN